MTGEIILNFPSKSVDVPVSRRPPDHTATFTLINGSPVFLSTTTPDATLSSSGSAGTTLPAIASAGTNAIKAAIIKAANAPNILFLKCNLLIFQFYIFHFEFRLQKYKKQRSPQRGSAILYVKYIIKIYYLTR